MINIIKNFFLERNGRINMTERLDVNVIDSWADDATKAPVALHLKQRLVSAEGEGAVIFPPTYAGIDYNIDTLADGTKEALIDSVGSQANRIEPLFKEEPYCQLIPQINIQYGDQGKNVSLLEVGHRLGDAVVRSSELKDEAHDALSACHEHGDAKKIAKISPTSLVFGVWDSRDTMAKIPRILQSVIRASDVHKLTRSAQYSPALEYDKLGVFSEAEKQKSESNNKSQLAQRGFVDVPSVGAHGGIKVQGVIERDVLINLIVVRRLLADNADNAETLRRYILGLALVAATKDIDLYLRQGCLLIPDIQNQSPWQVVHRSGKREDVALSHDIALQYAQLSATNFGVGQSRSVRFDKKLAKQDIDKKQK